MKDDLQELTPKSKAQARRWSQVLALVPVYLLQFCYGMNQGYPAILTPQLMECKDEFQVTLEEESWIVSLDNFATPVVCILSGYLQQALGPKIVVIICCVPYTLGWILTAVANSVEYLYIARLLVGVSTAIITTTVYTVEVSSKDMRGSFSLIESVLRCAGCLVVYALGFVLRWNTIAIYSPVLPAVALVIGFFVPESPIFLMHKNKTQEAEAALTKLFGPEYNVQDEMLIIKESKDKQQLQAAEWSGHDSTTVWGKFIQKCYQMKMPEVYKPLLIIFFLNIGQQFNGLNVLRVYIVQIFDYVFNEEGEAGDPLDKLGQRLFRNITNGTSDDGCVQTSAEAYYSAMLVGLFRLLASLLLSNLLLRYRRRAMYFVSSILSIVSLIAFGVFNFIVAKKELEPGLETGLKSASLGAACTLVFAVQLGLQTLPMLLSSELFPSEVRAFCKGITRSFACIMLVLSLKFFPLMEEKLALYGTFFLFAAILTISLPVVYFTLPETKDLGLELIRYYFTPPQTIFYIDINDRIPDFGESSAKAS